MGAVVILSFDRPLSQGIFRTASPCRSQRRPGYAAGRRRRDLLAPSGHSLAEQATEAAKLTPEQQTAIRRVIREGLADQARERLAQRLEFRARLADAVAQQIRDRGAPSDTVGRGR